MLSGRWQKILPVQSSIPLRSRSSQTTVRPFCRYFKMVFTEKQIDITSMNVRTSKQGRATIIMTFDIHGTEELNRITDKIRQIDGVLDIQRTTADETAASSRICSGDSAI